MYAHRNPLKRFDIIDLDPYGSAAPFVDAAIQAVADGGLICVTCTDMAVLSGGNNIETCFGNYGTMPLKTPFCHELALRSVLRMVEQSAARYKKHIIPLVSCSIDFYVRLFLKVVHSPAETKKSCLLVFL
jgi:tRNA (guanine26-N2/guanine27-N2)-dimethyltransferase